MTKTIQEYQDEIGKWAKEKGWWEDERNEDDLVFLVITELVEAFEHWRNGREINETWEIIDKPDGVPYEIADAIIRIIEAATYYKVDLSAAMKKYLFLFGNPPKTMSGWAPESYNYFHKGQLKTFGYTESEFGAQCLKITQIIANLSLNEFRSEKLAGLMVVFLGLCHHLGYDIEALIDRKMEYNWTRQKRHGGKRV